MKLMMSRKELSLTRRVGDESGEVYEHHQRIRVIVSSVVYGFDGEQIKVLLTSTNKGPNLIATSMLQEESADDAARRMVKAEIGIECVSLHQINTFCFRGTPEEDYFVLISFLSLVSMCQGEIPLGDQVAWFPTNAVPSLDADSSVVLLSVKAYLQKNLVQQHLHFELLPAQFTLKQIRHLHELVYEKKLDRRNFSKQLKLQGCIKRLNKKEVSSSKKKKAYLYTATIRSEFFRGW